MNHEKCFEIDFFSGKEYKSFGLHRHDFCELIFVIEGKLGFLVNDKLYKADESCIILFKEGRLHTSEVDPDTVYTRYNLNFRRSFVSGSADFDKFNACFDSDCTVLSLEKGESARIKKLFEELYENSLTVGLDAYSGEICRHLICAVLMYVSRISENNPSAGNNCIDSSYIAEAVTYINDHLTQKLLIEDIANALFVSRAKLITDFKAATGITVGDYITMCRMKHAKKMLLAGEDVASAAVLSGFPNTCHFIRTFKKHNGITPLQYARKRLKGDK